MRSVFGGKIRMTMYERRYLAGCGQFDQNAGKRSQGAQSVIQQQTSTQHALQLKPSSINVRNVQRTTTLPSTYNQTSSVNDISLARTFESKA